MIDNSTKTEDGPNSAAPPAGADLLPPVEPPSAGFIIQLFVVPALIVMVIFGVWLTISSLVRRTSPEQIIEVLEHGRPIARWQRASELADVLRNERYAEFKRSPDAAAHVARILDREIDAGAMSEDEVEFRKYLAHALGEFEVREGIDVLVKAARTNRDPRENAVRDAALQAIAVRVYNMPNPEELAGSDVESALLELARDEDSAIRFQAAFALGHLGTPPAIERLEELVDDPHADTRYNAAIALAHRGNDRAVETLAEMLDPEELAGGTQEKNPRTHALHRGVIVHTAIEAAQELARKNAKADLALVIEALQQLADADRKTLEAAQLPPRVATEAHTTLQAIERAISTGDSP
jgi:HEAT repeat protein